MMDNQNKSTENGLWERVKSLLREPRTETERIRRRIAGRIAVSAVGFLMIGAILFALTSAWYTNTIQANEITLQTGKWNFDGTITLGGEKDGTLTLGSIYPGDSRILPFSVENKDTRGVNIRVEADKSALSDKLQERIYLYVEKTETNGTKTRYYINRQWGYQYAVEPGKTLKVTKDESTEPQENETQNTQEILHLQWVYDVTGYFLLGTVSADGRSVTGQKENSNPEYLMPVIYDLDRAIFDSNGKLYSVAEVQTSDGASTGTYAKQSREDFLKMLFEEYASNFNKTVEFVSSDTADKKATTVRGNYYAVDVDESGYGVWLYLADKAEIELATKWDTDEAAKLTQAGCAVKLIFKGQNQTETK